MDHSLFSLFPHLQYRCNAVASIKNCQRLDSNRRSLVVEVTALPSEPQPLPKKECHLIQVSCLPNFHHKECEVGW